MKYLIKHINHYRYETLVEQSLNKVRLKPRNNECQRVISYDIEITPLSMTKEYIDIWRNNIESFFIAGQHSELMITSTTSVSIQRAPYIHQLQFSPEMKNIFFSQMFREHYLAYLSKSIYTTLREDQLQFILGYLPNPNDNPIQFALELMKFLFEAIEYNPDTTHVQTTAEEAFDLKSGVCQDFTQIMLAVLRHCQIPARYISGYLYSGEEDNLVGDTATHAWVEIMIPGIGWIGLDPTNNVEVLENHITLCVGRDFRDVSPVEGVYVGGKNSLKVSVEVKKIAHL